MTRELQVPEWSGGVNWTYEVRRQMRVMQCRSGHHRRFILTCRQLTPERLRSPVQCNRAAVEAILPLLENARLHRGSIMGPGSYSHRHGWTRAELGELLVIARNRLHLYSLGRERPKPKGPRLDPYRLPDHRLEALIQRHPDLALVDQLRAERRRRQMELAHV